MVNITIRPALNALTVLLVLYPVSLISWAIVFGVDAKSMSVIIHPVAFINVSIRMDQSPLPVCIVVFPPPLIEGAIRPELGATSLSDLSVNDPTNAK
jgi:hypothetical protein